MPLLDEFFPFDIGYGAPANTARWRKMAQLWQIDGVVYGYLNQCNATLAGTTVTVQSGGVFIHGYYGEVQNPMSVTGVGTNGTVVAGVDLVAQTISIYYRDGVVSYGTNPTTNYEQDANKWEIPLWLVNGTNLFDLRTRTTPDGACSGYNAYNGTWNLASSQTGQLDLMPLWIPYSGFAEIRGELQVSFSDASQAQSAICSLTYQYNQSDAQTPAPAMTPAIPGGGPAAQPDARIVATSGALQVTQGRRNVGWLVTAGTGPGIALPKATVSLRMISMPAMY